MFTSALTVCRLLGTELGMGLKDITVSRVLGTELGMGL